MRFIDIKNMLYENRKQLLITVAKIDDYIFYLKQSAENWSLAEILHHIFLSEKLINKLLKNLRKKSNLKLFNKHESSEIIPIKQEIKELNLDNTITYAPFPGTEPESNINRDKLFALLKTWYIETEKNLKKADEYDFRSLKYKHPIFGMINYYE